MGGMGQTIDRCISERESRKFEEGLNTKVKLDMYKHFGNSVEFKKYLHGIFDAGSRLLFKFRSGTQGTFHSVLPSLPLCLPNSSFRTCVEMSVRR